MSVFKDQIEFHGAEELVSSEQGLRICRLPSAVRSIQDDGCAQSAFHCSGVELRFRMLSDTATVYLRMEDVIEGLPAQIFYGSFQGGWVNSVKQIGTSTTAVTIQRTPRMKELLAVYHRMQLPFHPELVRILLPYGKIYYEGCEGATELPHQGDAPEKTLLTYGSSITHGSLSLGGKQCYAARLAAGLGMDWVNVGLAGCCHCEPGMAEYLVSRKDWDCMTCELGINMLSFTPELFRERVHHFLRILAADGRQVYVTSIFGFIGDREKADIFRKIVQEECGQAALHYTDGPALLSDPSHVSEDLVHPATEGHEEIASRWLQAIRGC